MTEKQNLWIRHSTCLGLENFLVGCMYGCRNQWNIIKTSYDRMRETMDIQEIQKVTKELLFNCFLYVFCQNQFSIILDHITAILGTPELNKLKSESANHFKPFKVVANGMKHLNRSIKELSKSNERETMQFYNFSGTKLTFGDSNAECISEEPLIITEELYSKIKPMISRAREKLYNKFISLT